jgi:hypothetical protein
MDRREDEALAEKRWADLELLQQHYEKFEDLLYDVITDLLGFVCTEIQEDIAKFLAYGPSYKMIQAQRGQAKTTITACYAVWRLIHDPRTRVLILSAGTDMAQEISNWVIQILMHMPELACLRPDTSAGDRSSVKAFDVHYTLKGAEKSPSVACVGITSNIQGRRADVLIADDIESAKNSQTATQRERLNHLTRDFTSICSTGDIIYLGTPQNNDSVYNSLPSRGFTVRIWTGRYPTEEELPNYREYLAPLILERINDDASLQTGGGPTGTRGKPVDPLLLDEEKLTAKEIDQGRAYFQLQHMLDTKLMDEDRYPLKSRDIIFMSIPGERCPLHINWNQDEHFRLHAPQGFPLQDPYYEAHGFGDEFGYYTGCHMYIDPAGGGKNGDELAYAVTKSIGGKVLLIDAAGMPGGFTNDRLDFIVKAAVKWKPKIVQIEKNFGNGAFTNILTPVLHKEHKCGIEEVWETGQKELRIIDILEPIIGRNALIVDKDLIARDWASVQKYPTETRATYSLMFQLSRITRDKGALMHDDRLDAVAGSCRFWVNQLVLDNEKVAAKIKNENYSRLMNNPLGNGRKVPGLSGFRQPNALDKFKRRT